MWHGPSIQFQAGENFQSAISLASAGLPRYPIRTGSSSSLALYLSLYRPPYLSLCAPLPPIALSLRSRPLARGVINLDNPLSIYHHALSCIHRLIHQRRIEK